MKLSEFAQPKRAKQAAQVFESYFGNAVALGNLTHRQAQAMLGRVQGLILEHRRTREYHQSQENPAYTKLMLLQDVLCSRLNEDVAAGGMGSTTLNPTTAAAAQADKNKQKAAQMQQINKVKDPMVRDALKAGAAGKTMTPDQQQSLSNAAIASGAISERQVNELSKKTLGSYAKKAGGTGMNSAGVHMHSAGALGGADGKKSFKKGLNRARGVERAIDRLANESDRRTLRKALNESELNQAQVVLAAKDLSDRIQKMLEDAGTMQFKDLPALVNEIRDEVGVPQSTQYSEQAGQVLGALVQAVQQAKTGIDGAMGIVTGQGQMEVPGEAPMAPPAPDMGGDMGGELPPPPPEMGGDMGGEELPPPPPEEEPGAEEPGSLGRERR